uniref:Uncharacterized protein n=1 Tax=viral metagenome TaxID=1070528 RepID=A0A6C0EHF1_9ZZZZ
MDILNLTQLFLPVTIILNNNSVQSINIASPPN